MSDAETMVESLMCALLRGESVRRAESRDSSFERRYRDCAAYHGIGPLLAQRISLTVPGDRHEARDLKDEMAIELVRKHELVRVLNALAKCGVTPLLLKGTALAYSIYPSPALRPRIDTDLLIAGADREITARILSELGYEKPNALSGNLVSYQCGYAMQDRFHIDHVLDVHWRISNAQVFSRTLDYDELISRAILVPALGDHARALAPVDALLLACMHRVHHFHSPYRVGGLRSANRDRLIWLYDIHLLVDSMSPGKLAEFTQLAEQTGMRAICRDGLLQARRCFGTRLPEEALQSLTKDGPSELSALHLRKGGIRHLLTELQALPRWGDRVALLGEHLIPPADYMLEKYAAPNRTWLPMLYLQRCIHGAWKRIQDS